LRPFLVNWMFQLVFLILKRVILLFNIFEN
jgi:hypothetical protein